MSASDAIDLCNKACLAAGVNIITSFTEGTAEAKFCAEWYEQVVTTEISLYKWRSCTTTFDLTLNVLADPPDTKWNTAYQMPGGVLSVDTVLVGEDPIAYDRHKDQIHTNDTASDTVILKYRYRADESHWEPYLELVIIYRLATMLAFSIARSVSVAEKMDTIADRHWRRAKTEDAQAQTNQKVKIKKLLRNRNGRANRFWRNR